VYILDQIAVNVSLITNAGKKLFHVELRAVQKFVIVVEKGVNLQYVS